MKIAGGLKENEVVVGNAYDKYAASNPIVRRLMNRFASALSTLVAEAAPETIHEIGCGEGFWVLQWAKTGFTTKGSDFSKKVIDMAQANAVEVGISPEIFKTRSIYELSKEEDAADLVVCCEVLEHLDNPEKGLRAISGIANPHVILSVPREPVWRLLNVMRGKYLADYGNTPGHIQHWSKRKFIRMLEKHFRILRTETPLPWTMVLCKPKKQ